MKRIIDIENKYIRKGVAIIFGFVAYPYIVVFLPVMLVCSEVKRAWENFSIWFDIKESFKEINCAFIACWKGRL